MTAKKEDRKIMEGIREFIKGCPCIQTYLDALKSDVNVEYLKDDEKNYSIESEPIDPIIRKYMDGSAIKQFAFIFSSRESYGREVIENLSNCGFYEEFAEWLEECDKGRTYPDIGEKREVMRVKASTTPYVFDTSETTAKYQIQVIMKYYQKA
ncbi:chloramphenicol resistance protein [Faecalicatena contorta]|uniref:chloramphenicol resistance protein n=1 Tax=Faecalicatena contorta TaxID=39482 RepID=UPI00129ED156|nr:chloramphenicol resistance protein [Faecalicatena contorta]MRM91223.1 chloramphenicol resistance protein [Faecalicatena contorta]